MSQQVLPIPAGDSESIPYRMLLPDGTYQHLTGYTVTLTVKQTTDQATPSFGPYAGVVRASDDTYADIPIPKDALTAGSYPASTIVAANAATGDKKTKPITLQVGAHG
jgi:hypothetical protein